MNKLTQDDATSHDIIAANINELKAIFPEAFTEGKIDFDVLKETLGEYRETREERYNFSWAGKSKARRLAQTPSTGTLRPCPEESVDWDKTENLFIEGDNLEVLKLLQKSYQGQVKMIYIDPPYNTGGDFVYPDKYADNLKGYLEYTNQVDADGNKQSTNTEASGRYHSNWLNMMLPRLQLAKNLLKKDGVIFISIDDNEVKNLNAICNEVFGEECFIGCIPVLCNPKGRSHDKYLATCHEYLLAYSNSTLEKGSLNIPKTEEEIANDYPLKDSSGVYRELELRNTHREFGRFNRPNLWYPIYLTHSGKASLKQDELHNIEVYPCWDDGFEGCWTWGEPKAETNIDLLIGNKVGGNWKIYRKAYANENGSAPTKQLKSIWLDKKYHTEKGQAAFNSLFDTKNKIFQSPKSLEVISDAVRMVTSNKDVVLDFFSGSCSSAHAVLGLNADDGGNRKFIMVQLPEPCPENSEASKNGYKTIAEIGKERIRRAAKKIKEEHPSYQGDLGFKVFKLDSSNIEAWDSNVENLEDNVLNAANVLKDDRTELDIVYELFLKYGLDLSYPVNTHEVAGKKVYEIGAGSLFICLEDGITTDFVEGLIKLYESFDDEAAPRVVFKDSGFKTDAAKKDAESTLKDAGILDVKCL
jgi:adenine-specific DNA-methyltransferase